MGYNAPMMSPPTANPSPADSGFRHLARPAHAAERPAQREQRQRHGDHMRVQVAIEEGEQRELSDLVASARRDDAARVPVPVSKSDGKRAAFERQQKSLKRPCPALEDACFVVPAELQPRPVAAVFEK